MNVATLIEQARVLYREHGFVAARTHDWAKTAEGDDVGATDSRAVSFSAQGALLACACHSKSWTNKLDKELRKLTRTRTAEELLT